MNSSFSPSARPRPANSPTIEASNPITSDSNHGGQDLSARSPDRPQRGELARPLGDGDRQRVEDHERADEQGDAGE